MRPARRALVLFLAFALPATAAPDPPSPDEQLVKTAFLTSDGPALVEFFRKRTKGQATPEKIQALIAQLGDTTTGDTAAAELVALGSVAVPLLRQAAKDPDDTAAAAR